MGIKKALQCFGIFCAGLLPGDAWAMQSGVPVSPSDPIARAIVAINEGDPLDTYFSKHCTGILVRADMMLTAAHCADDVDGPKKTFNGFVTSPLSHGKTCGKAAVKKAYLPPGLRENRNIGLPIPDLALIELERPICGVTPVGIEQIEAMQSQHNYWSAGFGAGTPEKAIFPHKMEINYPAMNKEAILRHHYRDVLDMRFDDPEETGKVWYDFIAHMLGEFSGMDFLFPVKPGSSICKGDSGGPVYRLVGNKIMLVGVNSAVLPHPKTKLDRCNDGYIQIIQPLAQMKKWLQAVIGRR